MLFRMMLDSNMTLDNLIESKIFYLQLKGKYKGLFGRDLTMEAI